MEFFIKHWFRKLKNYNNINDIIIPQQSQRNMFYLYCIYRTDNSPIVDPIKSSGSFIEFFIKHWFWKLKNYHNINDFTL